MEIHTEAPALFSAVVMTTRCRSTRPAALNAFWRRMRKAMTASYAIEMPAPVAPWAPRKEKWEAIRCSSCQKRTYRLMGDGARRLCRGCDKAVTASQLQAIGARRGRS